MSIFGDSRAVRVLCQKKMPSENQFFLDEGAMGLQQGYRVLGGQIPFLGVCNTLGASGRAFSAKVPFS